MSYTSFGGKPDDLDAVVQFDKVLVSFTCPRCGSYQGHLINANALLYGFSIECQDHRCRKPTERYGFELTMYPNYEQSILGQNDRPLHFE